MRSKRTLKTAAAGQVKRAPALRLGRRGLRQEGRRSATRERLLDATLTTLRTHGFVGTTAREIARTGKLNQALIFYHYGSLDRLLLAALDLTSARRLARYQAALAEVASLSALINAMASLYAEDVEVGHVAAVQEMVAGGSSIPALRAEVVARMEPWVHFAESVISRLVKGTAFEPLVPTGDMAYAAVALYFGIETLTHLHGDRSKAETLFKTAARFATVADRLLELAEASTP